MGDIKMDINETMEELSFEQALGKLEDIVDHLSSGSGNLDELLRMYELGIKYLNQCKSKLEEAEAKISILSKDIPTNAKED